MMSSFSMDASRSDPSFLYEVIEAVIDAGAGNVTFLTLSGMLSHKNLGP